MTVLIVDDDSNTVQMIEDSVPWEEYGIEQVYTAFQGVQALEQVENRCPDIVISDIEMPQMDGIQLVEAIKKRSGTIPEIIFLTAHADFALAQKAIYYGVSAYLVKPFRLEELSGALTRTVLKCRQRRQLTEEQRNAEMARNYLISDFVRGLLWGHIKNEPKEIEKEARKRNISFNSTGTFRLLYVIIPIDAARAEGLDSSELFFAFRNLGGEILYNNTGEFLFVENEMRPYYLLLSPASEILCNAQELESRCIRLIDVAKTYLHMDISCAISLPVLPVDFSAMREQMDTLVMQNRIEGSILKQGGEERDGALSDGISVDALADYLSNHRKIELISLVRDYLVRLDEKKQNDAAHMQALHHDVMQVFYSFINGNQVQVAQLFQDAVFRQLNEAAEFSSKNMLKYVTYLYDRSFDRITALQQSDSLIGQVKDYIHAHLTENIKREEIAAAVFVTPNYLSNVFREEIGTSLREYINQARVEEAKKLLATTSKSITEIALIVGFENIPYFSTIFKKYCGSTPAAWRNELKDWRNQV